MNKIKRILIFDTSVATTNLGDSLIMESVLSELTDLFPDAYFSNSSTHEVVGRVTYALNKLSDISFVGGTNLLSSNMRSYNQWRISLLDACFLNNIVLIGVGWWQYQKKPDFYTRILLRRVLDKYFMHSVRDEYSRQQLLLAGIENVVNTGCPTMWGLTEDHCREIPETKSTSVIFTLTDYKKDFGNDSALVNFLRKTYAKIYFWPQGAGDLEYLHSLDGEGIEVLSPSVHAYNGILSGLSSIDYVGTRLHAGIRALQYKRKSIIIGVDNRAHEIAKDTDLPVVPRGDSQKLEHLIHSSWPTAIRLKSENIQKWKNQFQEIV